MNNKPGYILVLTVMILSLTTLVATKLYVKARIYNTYLPLSFKREQARMLAVSGISIALAQLSVQDQKITFKDEKKVSPVAATGMQDQRAGKGNSGLKEQGFGQNPQEAQYNARRLLKTLLLVQNTWQTFLLTSEKDGIDAVIKICITCEDGKINLNHLWDFKKKRFNFSLSPNENPKKLFEAFGKRISSLAGAQDVFENIETFLKKRAQPLQDITELLESKQMWEFKDALFFQPEGSSLKDSVALLSDEQKKKKIFLTDIFTVWSDESVGYPLLFSHSIRAVLGLPLEISFKDSSQELASLVENIPLESVDWITAWDKYAKPYFNKSSAAVPKELLPFLAVKFEPRVFSVLCYAEVGTVQQKLLAILERSRVEKGEEFKVKKIYWI